MCIDHLPVNYSQINHHCLPLSNHLFILHTSRVLPSIEEIVFNQSGS